MRSRSLRCQGTRPASHSRARGQTRAHLRGTIPGARCLGSAALEVVREFAAAIRHRQPSLPAVGALAVVGDRAILGFPDAPTLAGGLTHDVVGMNPTLVRP